MPHPKKTVIPAKAGIQEFNGLQSLWIPAFAGMTPGVVAVLDIFTGSERK